MHGKVLIFGVATPLNVRNLHKIPNHKKLYKSHIIKFYGLNLQDNEYELKNNLHKYLVQNKAMYIFFPLLQHTYALNISYHIILINLHLWIC
jgi:hypothetical protein